MSPAAAGRQALAETGYRQAARITRDNGTTYYWGTLLLPPERRRHVYAVYALCRMADDIVDAPSATTPGSVERTGAELEVFRERVGKAIAGEPTDEPIMAAIADSFARCDIPMENVDRFFGAMAQDLTQSSYETWDDLVAYMEGSAAVIGEMMLPVLKPLSRSAFGPARSLGFAFQLTNFLRDIGEDLDRGRVYVPQEDLRRFGADPWVRVVTPEWRELMRFEIARNRELYAQADAGIPMLPSSSARCVGTARELYARILEGIEQSDYDVFTGRVRVASWSKAMTSARVLAVGPRQRRKVGAR
ncbi:MAG: phytoene/squalene synthase family protein [Lapillicoccus sp.]